MKRKTTEVVKEDMTLVGVERRGCRGHGETEEDDWLWPPPKGNSGKEKKIQ